MAADSDHLHTLDTVGLVDSATLLLLIQSSMANLDLQRTRALIQSQIHHKSTEIAKHSRETAEQDLRGTQLHLDIICAPIRALPIFAYMLVSASSAATSQNYIWMSRFGGDRFTKIINASVSMSFLAFSCVAFSSVISAHYLFSSIS